MRGIVIRFASVLLVMGSAAHADLGLVCPAGPPKRTTMSCRDTDSGRGSALGVAIVTPAGKTATGDPIILADQTTFQRVVDYSADAANGRIEFVRSYSSTSATFNYGIAQENIGVPKPFGSSPSGCASSPNFANCSLRWWHNWFAYAGTVDADPNWGWGPQPWLVRDQDGFPVIFKGSCGVTQTQPCSCSGLFACGCPGPTCSPETVGNAERSRLVNLTPDVPLPRLMLQQGDGTKLYFDAALGKFISRYGRTFYFLTSVANGAGKTVASIDYEFPASCTGAEAGAAGTSPGVPYIKYIRVPTQGQTPGVGSLKFYYKLLPNPGSGNECVVDHVTAISAVAATGALSETTVATFVYTQTGGVESAGLIATATKPSGQESYAYVEPSGLSGFHMSGAGQEWVHQTYNNGVAVSVSSPWSGQSVNAVAAGAGDPVCGGSSSAVRIVVDSLTGRGDVSSATAPLTTRRTLLPDSGLHEWRSVDLADSCDLSAPNSCSPGTVHHEYNCDANPQVERGIRNKRGFWHLFESTFPTDRNATHIEMIASKTGATSLTDPSPLETERYSYTYLKNDPTDAFADMQLKASVKRTSLLAAGGADAETRTVYPIDAAGNLTSARVQAVIRHGWTNVLDASGNAQLQERYVGTFYFTNRKCSGEIAADPQDRTLEVHGPCLVDPAAGFNATDCSPTLNATFPITQNFYAPPANADGSVTTASGQLSKMIRYTGTNTPTSCPSTQAGATTALVTQYLNYDAFGHPTDVIDPSGSETVLQYSDGLMTSQTIGGATTSFTYDTRKLRTVTYPGGNIEVSCYRTGVNCDGAWTNLLQWKAITDAAHVNDGTFWAERVEYSYRSDGTLAVETYRDSSANGGAVRRVRKYAFDAHRRNTLEGWGGTSGIADAATFFGASSYDGANNRTGVGLPFNSPPAWCGGVVDVVTGNPNSSACAALQYDAADRLSQMTEFPAVGTAQRTLFSYDGNGNVVGVKTGCTGSDTYATCTKPASTYTYDDFGNVLSATIGGASSGATLFEADAAGNVIKKRTASMAAGSWLKSIYDAASRLLEVDSVTPTATALLYKIVYDDGGVVPPTGCGADLSPTASRTLGRVRYRQDSFGYTWLRYDPVGRVIDEIRSRDGTCTGNANNTPSTHYVYNVNGDLSSIVYPYGRTVQYVYGAGAQAGRISSVTVTLNNGTTWQAPTTIISSVQWEPYGGLRSYQVGGGVGQPTRLVEYLPGDNAASPGCPAARPSSNDATGRLRALWVSTVGGVAQGDVLKLTYTWQADQIIATDTCLLGSTTPRTETFSYDATLRLTGAGRPAGNFAATGGAFSSRSYAYDGRGNRTSAIADATALTSSYAASQVDRLTGLSAAGALYGYTFSYDADGRVTTRLGPIISSGSPVSRVDYAPGPDPGGANDTVFKYVLVNGSAYNYFYDALNRRRSKSYPTNVSDEYFYDLGHQLLVDQGNSSLSFGLGTPMLDEYVWLGGRPAALIRSNLTSAWAHQADGDGTPFGPTCVRNDDGFGPFCGIYFPVSDVIGKPVLMLSAAGGVVGTGEYDPFGHVNRVFIDAETSHPYGTTNGVFATVAPPALAGLSTDVRVLVDAVDLARQDGNPAVCLNRPTAWDLFEVRDSAGTVLVSMGGFGGPVASGWGTPPAQLAIRNLGTCSFTPDATGNCTTSCDGVVVPRSKSGVVAGSYEYRRYQSGYFPFWTPLRFPGQYYDAESDLFENWNRYYDPNTGRYLQSEPGLQKPELIRALAGQGRTLAGYGYAQNNPLKFEDPDGMLPCPGGKWIGAPLGVVEGTYRGVSGLVFAGVYSCLGASTQAFVVSFCGSYTKSGPRCPVETGGAGGVGFGFATDTPDSDNFSGMSAGMFGYAGIGPAAVTGFAEGHNPLKPDSWGILIGPGAGFGGGPLGCKTVVLGAWK